MPAVSKSKPLSVKENPIPFASDAEMILSCLPIGPTALRKLLQEKSAAEILENPPENLKEWKTLVNLTELKKKLSACGSRFVSTPKVSPCLLDLPDAPLGLFAKGPLDISTLFNCVAIFGTRQPTEYGKKFAHELAGFLAERAIPVISGLALGIDAAAHQGALDAQGPTVGVLGNGIDIVYPSENKKLFEAVGKKGLLLSEFSPGRPPDRQTFPRRNRIIVALASAVVVVESDMSGGAMITAEIAQKMGRRIFALPGRIDQPTSRGPHKLIQNGATLIASPEDFYRQFTNLPAPTQSELFDEGKEGKDPAKNSKTKRKANLPKRKPNLAPELAALNEGEALSPDELSRRSNTPIEKISSMLLMLEMEGTLTKRLDGKYEVS